MVTINKIILENMTSNVHNRLKFGKISRKNLLCTKMQKNG